MHRTITSDDVMRYPNGVRPRDVQFHEEDNIEYRGGRLMKSNRMVTVTMCNCAI